MTEINLRIGGAAGDGIASMGEIFARACARTGLHVSAYNSYQSVIRGGHVWFHVRASDQSIRCEGDSIDLLIALNSDTAKFHSPLLDKDGGIVYDPSRTKLEGSYDAKLIEIPLIEIAGSLSRGGIVQNTVAMGTAAYLLDLDLRPFKEVLTGTFSAKGEDVVKMNIDALQAGCESAEERCRPLKARFKGDGRKRFLLTGNQAIAIGAAAAGCRFLAQYPMTPATGVLHWLASHSEKYGVLVKQTEDEIAAVNMTIGAAFAGARAMAATSGGGFSLMTEALGLAGILEVPIVIVESQRVGPSTGLPTKTEQGDLNQVLGASQGEFPRIVLAPRNVEEAYYMTAKAFDLADRYQTPVIVMSDYYLSEHYESVDDLDLEVNIDRGKIAEPSERQFKRYRLTEDGVSPRAFPGTPGLEFIAGSDEHDEAGTLVSDVLAGTPYGISTREMMMEKRMLKLESARAEMGPPELWGPEDADMTLISWGSTQCAVRGAVERLSGSGLKVNSMEFNHIHPLPIDKVATALSTVKKGMLVESNYTGQFARHLRAEVGFVPDEMCLRYDGEPMTSSYIVYMVKEVAP